MIFKNTAADHLKDSDLIGMGAPILPYKSPWVVLKHSKG